MDDRLYPSHKGAYTMEMLHYIEMHQDDLSDGICIICKTSSMDFLRGPEGGLSSTWICPTCKARYIVSPFGTELIKENNNG